MLFLTLFDPDHVAEIQISTDHGGTGDIGYVPTDLTTWVCKFTTPTDAVHVLLPR